MLQGFVLCDGGVDLLQISHQRLDVLITHKAGGGTDLMDDAPLHLAVGIDRANGLHKTLQAIHTEQIDVQNSPAFEVIQHIQPEFAALVLPNPHAQDILRAIHCNTQNHIRCLRLIRMILLHLVMDGLQKYERIHRLQGSVLPRCDLRHNLLADLTYQLRRDVHIVQALDLLRDVPLAHSAGIQPQNFLFHPICIPAVLANDLRLIFSVSIPRNLHFHRSQLGFYRLF